MLEVFLRKNVLCYSVSKKERFMLKCFQEKTFYVKVNHQKNVLR
jgi:hypothetical protein